eukprot:gene763-946_t
MGSNDAPPSLHFLHCFSKGSVFIFVPKAVCYAFLHLIVDQLRKDGCGGYKTVPMLGVETSKNTSEANNNKGQQQECKEEGKVNGNRQTLIDGAELYDDSQYNDGEPLSGSNREMKNDSRSEEAYAKIITPRTQECGEISPNTLENNENFQALKDFCEELKSNSSGVMGFSLGDAAHRVEHRGSHSIGLQLEKVSERNHVRKIDFQANIAKLEEVAPHLVGLENWENIPDFVVITGKNGSGKTQLLNYIYTQLKRFPATSHINVLLQTGINFNWNSSNSEGRDPNYYINPKNHKSLVADIQGYYTAEKERERRLYVRSPLHEEIIEKINNKHLSFPPNEKVALEEWMRQISDLIDRHKDFCCKDHDIDSPIAILNQVSKIYRDKIQALKNKYQNFSYCNELFTSYCNRDKVDLNNLTTYKDFFTNIASPSFLNQLIEGCIREKIGPLSPLEEANAILEAHHFNYRFKTIEGSVKDREFDLVREAENGNITINPNDLSSGEKVALHLLSQLFYFRGLSADGKNPAPTKHLDILLLDEPDRHLDPVLCQTLYHIISKEFVAKHHVQVFMTTHRPDAVFFAPENSVYTIGESQRLQPDKAAAITRMTSNIISPVANARIAYSMLSGGKLTVLEDSNYVLTENIDDTKFYTTIYQKLQRGCPNVVSNKTNLIFMPVGINLDQVGEKARELRSTYNRIKQQVEGLHAIMPKENINALQGLLPVLDNQLSTLASYVDQGNGGKPVKEKVNRALVYQGNYDEKGRVIKDDYLKIVKENGRAKYHRLSVLWGIVDNDEEMLKNGTKATGQVHALNVYSFENYLCMPLNLLYHIRQYDPVASENFNFENHQGIKKDQLQLIFEYKDQNFENGVGTQEQLQQISDWVLQYLQQLNPVGKICGFTVQYFKNFCSEEQLQKIAGWSKEYQSNNNEQCQIFNKEDSDDIELIGGHKVKYGKAFSTTKGHTLVEIMSRLMPDTRNEYKVNGIFRKLRERLQSSETDEHLKQELYNALGALLRPDEKNIRAQLFNSLEKMPVAYLPKSLLKLIERLQNSEVVKETNQKKKEAKKSKK